MGEVIYLMDRKPLPLYNAASFGSLAHEDMCILPVNDDVLKRLKTEGLLDNGEIHILLNSGGCHYLCWIRGITAVFEPAPKYDDILQGNLGTIKGHRVFTDSHFPESRRFLPDTKPQMFIVKVAQRHAHQV